MIVRMNKKLLQLMMLTVLLLPSIGQANEIKIRPFLIDETLVPRESTAESITLTSSYANRTAVLYATVNEITVGTNGEIKEFITPVMTDRTNTVTSWVELSRGRIEVPAGETFEVPLKIKVHPYAEPGEYHVFVGFVETKKRADAEKVALAGNAPGVIVKVTVADERVESMRISSMVIDRFITNSAEQQVAITIENAGEFDSTPTGEIIFYDNRGYELTALLVNDSNESIAPNESKTFVTNIPAEAGVGKYKANANLKYGQNQQASLYDSASFYMLPLYYLYLGIGLLLLLLTVLFVLMRRGKETAYTSQDGDEVTVFIRDGHDPKPKHHDIDLTT